MRRFLWIWLTLLGAFWATRALLAAAFQRVDRGAGSGVQLVLVPAAQAILVWWLTRTSRPAPRLVLRALLTPWLAFFLACDAVVVEADWLGGWHLAGFANALQGLAAGTLVAAAAVRGRWTRRERIWMGLFALWLPAAGAAFLVAGPPVGIGEAAVAGALFVLSVGLVLRVQVIWRARAATPAWLLDLGIACALAGAASVVLDFILHPAHLAPWGAFAHTCATFSLTALLFAAFGAFRPEWTKRPGPDRLGSPPAPGSPSVPDPRPATPHTEENEP
jgi:hypothetical protein